MIEESKLSFLFTEEICSLTGDTMFERIAAPAYGEDDVGLGGEQRLIAIVVDEGGVFAVKT